MSEVTPQEAPPSSRRTGGRGASGGARRRVGTIELRLTLAVVIMAALPFLIGVLSAVRLARKAADIFYDPRVGRELEAALDVYRPLVRALKYDMKHRADAIAASEPLRAAAALKDPKEAEDELRVAFDRYSDRTDPSSPDPPLVELASLRVFSDLSLESCLAEFAVGPGPNGASSAPSPAIPSAPPRGELTRPSARRDLLAEVRREAPVNPQRDYALVQCKSLGPPTANDDVAETKGPMLVATFVTERARIDHLKEADEFVSVYREIDRRREEWVRLNYFFFAALLAATILIAATVGFAFARSVSRRVYRVAEAAHRVAQGDLEVRVPEEGADEVGELAVSFNRMLREIERNRARIEYLQRVGAWQDMARRLAHEIKNPLTPIQLAVEEAHAKLTEKYGREDSKMRDLLDTTLEIVTEEVGTLRRLVSEFSEFARLPKARLRTEDLATLLGEIKPTLERLGLGTEPTDVLLTPSGGQTIPVKVTVDPVILRGAASGSPSTGAPVIAAPVIVAVDRQMLRKAIDNLARNAVQAIRASARGYCVVIHATLLDDGRVALDVDDDGPGVPAEARARIFDPYFTTRTEGTGLGLAIVKKIAVEHGATIVCDSAPLGGARFRIVLPPPESAEARAAIDAADRQTSKESTTPASVPAAEI